MSLIRKTKGIFVAASLLAAMCLSSAAYGQKAGTQQSPAQQAPAQQAPAQGNTSSQPQLKTEDISDAELKQFVQASAKAAAVQQESQKAMVAVVEWRKKN